MSYALCLHGNGIESGKIPATQGAVGHDGIWQHHGSQKPQADGSIEGNFETRRRRIPPPKAIQPVLAAYDEEVRATSLVDHKLQAPSVSPLTRTSLEATK